MDQPDHLILVIAITVCKVIEKFISEIGFSYQTDLLLALFSRLSGTNISIIF